MKNKRGKFKVTKKGLIEVKPKPINYKGIKVKPDNAMYKVIDYYGLRH